MKKGKTKAVKIKGKNKNKGKKLGKGIIKSNVKRKIKVKEVEEKTISPTEEIVVEN